MGWNRHFQLASEMQTGADRGTKEQNRDNPSNRQFSQ